MNNITACFTGYRSIFPLCLFLKASKYNFCRKIHKASAQLIKYSPPTLAEDQARHVSAMKENHRKLKTTGYNWRTLHNPRKSVCDGAYRCWKSVHSTHKWQVNSQDHYLLPQSTRAKGALPGLGLPSSPPKSPAKFFVVSMPRVIVLCQDKAS